MKEMKLSEKLTQGGVAAWPICLGYLPIGLAFGVLAQKAGLSPFQVALMSIFVFAGSSQFIAVSMLSAGASLTAIVATTFMVNLRHLLMSSSLAAILGKKSRWKLSLFAYGVTDESFAVNYTRLSAGDWGLDRSLVVNHTANLMWLISTVAGVYFGHLIPAHAMGIDYALTAMFICLLIFQLRDRTSILTAVMAGLLAVVLSLFVPGNAFIVLASMLAAAIGVFIKRGSYPDWL
ncbi:MAG: AzlC family ABC transporter permease [Thermodesulfobacteriota bacterium]